MSRYFDGIDDQVTWPIGGLSSLSAWTLVALLKFDAGVSWQGLLGCETASSGSEVAMGRHGTSGNFAAYAGGGANTVQAMAISSADGWVLLAVGRIAGANKVPRFTKYPIGGSPTHANATSGNMDNPASLAGGKIVFGQVDSADYFKGRLAAVAIFPSNLSDANRESLVTTMTRANWLSLSPSFLADELDAFNTDYAGTSDGATVTGTADDADDPTGWASWAGGGGGTEIFGAFSVDLTDSIAVAAKKEAKSSLVVPLTATVAAAGKKDAHGASAVPLTASVAVSSKKEAKAASATPLTASIAAAGKKDAHGSLTLGLTNAVATAATKTAHGALAVPLTVGVATSAKKTARATFDLPLSFDIATSGTVGGAIEGASSLAMTFGATTVGKKDAYGALALPLDADVASSGKKDAHGATSTPVTAAIVVAGKKNANATLDLPLTFLIGTAGVNPGARVLVQMRLAALARYELALVAEAQHELTLAAAAAYALTLEAEIA